MKKKEYQNNELIVHWFPELCSKSGVCTGGLPKVFDADRRPWIDVNQGEAQNIMEIIDRCPSGALKYSFPDDNKPRSNNLMRGNSELNPGHIDYEEENPPAVKIRVVKNGPLITKGTVEVFDDHNKLIKTGVRLAFCRCGMTNNPPFCDATHIKKGWKDSSDN